MGISVQNITNNINTEKIAAKNADNSSTGSIFDSIDKYSFDILKSPVKYMCNKIDKTHKNSRLWNFTKGLGDVADFIFSTEGLLTMGATMLALKGINKGATKLWGTKGGVITQAILKNGFIGYGGLQIALGMLELGKINSSLEDARHGGEKIGTGSLFVLGGATIKMKSTDIISSRKNISVEEIKARVTEIYNEVFDKMDIPEQNRPKLEFTEEENISGGSYSSNTHTIEFNIPSYRNGRSKSIEEVIYHEAEHTRQSLLRSRLTEIDAHETIKNVLLDRIANGEPEKILLECIMGDLKIMEPPRMSAKMRAEFKKFAEKELFTSDAEIKWSELHEKRVLGTETKYNYDTNIEEMLQNNPDFTEKYGIEGAKNILNDYIYSLIFRYVKYSRTNRGDLSYLKNAELSEKEKIEAIESLKGHLETIEGNVRNNHFEDNNSFYQYHLSSEEIAARNTAARMEKGKLEKMPRTQANIDRIRVLDFEIKYNEAGQRYYRLYNESLNNVDKTKELAEAQKIYEKMYYQRLRMTNELNYIYDFKYSPITGFATASQEK